MRNTPCVPAWRARLAPRRARAAQAVAHVRACTRCQLEAALGQWVPTDLFPKAAAKENSRDRLYTRDRTFWCVLWQSLNPEAAGREVVRQLQALFAQAGGPRISEEDGAYCRAKQQLPLSPSPKPSPPPPAPPTGAWLTPPRSRAGRSRRWLARR